MNAATPPVPIRSTTVWVVEDQTILRESLVEVINSSSELHCPFAFSTCEGFVEALDLGEVPDLVLMDIGLPGMSGIEGVKRLQSLSPTSRAIIHTIHEEDEKVFDAMCAGASGYLLKPSDPAALIQALIEVERGASPINPYIARKMLKLFSRFGGPRDGDTESYGLTTREVEILQHLVAGLTLQQIADELNLSYHTVSNHVRNVYAKLHVRSRAKAVAKALKEGLI